MTNDFDFNAFYQSSNGLKINSALIAKINNADFGFTNKRVLEIGFPLFAEGLKTKKPERFISCVLPQFANQLSFSQNKLENVIVADDYLLPFTNCFFDVVILNHSLEHSNNLNLFFKEVWRILADGGTLIIIIPSFFNMLRFSKQTPYYQTKCYFAYTLKYFLQKNKFTLEQNLSVLKFPNNFLFLKAEKKVFAPILTKTLAKSCKQKYAAFINCSSNFRK